MFGNNLRYFRLRKSFSMAQLASLTGLTAMSISYYEHEQRKPTMDVLKRLAQALDVSVIDFIGSPSSKLTFSHGEFRKTSSMTKRNQEWIRAFVENYCDRFFQALSFLPGKNVLPEFPRMHSLEFSQNIEQSAERLRRYLGLPPLGPVGKLIERTENSGLIVFFLDQKVEHFSGMNGTVNARPYVVLSPEMPVERIRSTLVHEIAHFAFQWPKAFSPSDIEDKATAIAGAFLMPKSDLIRELGEHRQNVSKDFEIVCQEYGISKSLLVQRSNRCGIISDRVKKNYYIAVSRKYGSRNNEPTFAVTDTEIPNLFRQLVYRGVSEDFISFGKGAELLHIPVSQVMKDCTSEV